MINKIRNWLLIKLAGERAVVINVEFVGAIIQIPAREQVMHNIKVYTNREAYESDRDKKLFI
ncbi:MAG: hypothetical protein KAS32_17515 [Candidatus Peribacteraceae bacterium]|nr:hypothetical protein [Candidatus Peribacteraceae bacterium]